MIENRNFKDCVFRAHLNTNYGVFEQDYGTLEHSAETYEKNYGTFEH